MSVTVDRPVRGGTAAYLTIAAATGVVGAVVLMVNLAIRAVTVSALDVPLPEFDPLTVTPVVVATVVGTAMAGVAFTALATWTRRPVRTFTALTSVGLVASLYPPVGLLLESPPQYPGTTGGTVTVLVAMHVVVAAAALAVLPAAWRRAMRRRAAR